MINTLTFRLRRTALLIADLVIIAWESRILLNIWQESGARMFRYYTQDSNILALGVCCICALFSLAALASGKAYAPRLTKSLRLMAASGLMITFLVAAFVLTPIESGLSVHRYMQEFNDFMLSGNMLYLHTLCPLLLLFSFLFLEDASPLPCSRAFLILPPTIVYGVITLYCNIARTYRGPYPFFHVYEQPAYLTAVWMALIVLASYLISLSLLALNRLIARHIQK